MARRTATVLEVASHSSPDKSYRVWVDATGPIFCDCPAHKFVRGGGPRKPCKHMRAVAASDTLTSAVAIATTQRPTTTAAPTDRHIRIIELQEEVSEGQWVTVTDLRRFTNLDL